jgi:adenylate cyclase
MTVDPGDAGRSGAPEAVAPDERADGAATAGGSEDGFLPLLAMDEDLLSGAPRYTTTEVARAAGVAPEAAIRLWRAMGFSEAAGDEMAFYGEDVDALKFAAHALASGLPLESVVRQTRIMNAAVSRTAEAISDEAVLALRTMREAGVSDAQAADWMRQTLDVERFEHLLGYFFRRQLRAALWRKLAVPADKLGDTSLTVGFVDLVRFTALTEDVEEDELEALVTRFEDVAHEGITGNGGRMIKMIGDEVMYVTDDPLAGIRIAATLVEAYATDERLPPARAGIASGSVLSRDGDYFGPVVNLASRIVDIARPNAVVTSDVVHDQLADNPDLTWRRLPPKRLKGIGMAWLWSVRAIEP